MGCDSKGDKQFPAIWGLAKVFCLTSIQDESRSLKAANAGHVFRSRKSSGLPYRAGVPG